MEDLSSYIILPMAGNESIQLLSDLISENSLSVPIIDTSSTGKVLNSIQYVISESKNMFVNSVQMQSNDSGGESIVDCTNEAFECPKCKLIFHDYSQYLIHSETHQNENLFECNKCDESFDELNLYQKHFLTHEAERSFKCTVCPKAFNFENNYKIHAALHENSSTCPICFLSFQRTASLKSHLVTHQVEEIYSCPECSSEFEEEKDLKKHIKTHSYDKAVVHNGLSCSYCKVKFDTPALLKQHVASHIKVKKLVFNGRRIRKTENSYREYKHKCLICSKTFPKLSLLERHTRIHTGERPYVCPVCDKGFNQKGTMEIHMMKHTAVKPFCCTLCPAKFTQKGNLKVHVEKTHTAATEGEKIFKCSKCDCIFKKVASLNGHMSKIHANNTEEVTITSVIEQLRSLDDQLNGNSMKLSKITTSNKSIGLESSVENVRSSSLNVSESRQDQISRLYSLKQKIVGNNKVYVCSYCDKETKKSSDLIRHLRTHTKEKPFKCHCGRTFSLKSTLKSHMQIHKVGKKCMKCSKLFFSTKSWNLHMRNHGASASDSPVTKTARDENLREFTSETIVKDDSSVANKHLKNQVCPVSFTRQSNLKRHSQLHTAEASFRCQLCSRSFLAAYSLNKHMKSHTSQKNFYCEICDKKFFDQSLLLRHISIHTSLQSYECPYCKKKFKNIQICRKHIKTHSNISRQEENMVLSLGDIHTLDNLNEPATLDINPDGIITSIGNYYITSNDNINTKNELVESQDIGESEEPKTVSTLKINGKEDVETIYLNCHEIVGEESLNNYFISHLKLQPNDTVLLDSSNEMHLKEPAIVFNVQTVVSNEPTSTDIIDDQFHLDDSAEDLINIPSHPSHKLILEHSDIIAPNIESVHIPIESDISDHFLANNISLYPNTQIRFDNSTESETLPFNLITIPDGTSDPAGNDDCSTVTDSNTCIIQENMKDVHCLVCEGIFENMSLYQSHTCAKSISKPNLESKMINESQLKPTEAVEKDAESSLKTRKRHFECVHCRNVFQSRGAYVSHINTHRKNKEGLHRCKFCDKQFKKPSDLNRHLRTHTGEKPFACDRCDKKFSLKSTLEGHYRTHDPAATKNFLCEICNSFFSSKSSRKSHMLIHTDVKPHKCCYCDQNFRTLAHKRGHEKTHLNRFKKNSPKKTKKIKNLLATVANMAVVDLNTNTSSLGQQESIGITEMQLDLSDHLNPSTKLTETIQIDPTLLQQLQNSNILLQDLDSHALQSPMQMNNTFESLDKLDDIANEEVLERSLECEVCHKYYASKDVLRKHMQLHIKNKFVCGKCSKWFSSYESLTEHEKLHSGYRPFSCFLCTNTFAELQHLKSHLKRIHQIVDTNSPLILKMSMGETLHL